MFTTLVERRIAQELGAREGRDERNARGAGDRLRRCRCRRADRADQRKDMIVIDQFRVLAIASSGS